MSIVTIITIGFAVSVMLIGLILFKVVAGPQSKPATFVADESVEGDTAHADQEAARLLRHRA